MVVGIRAHAFMIGRPRNSVEFARRGFHGRRLTPEEIAIEAEKLGLPVSRFERPGAHDTRERITPAPGTYKLRLIA